jgi:anti-anti-sigma regulatory factor
METRKMSPNFRIKPTRNDVKIILKLSGDFDGSSAFELINALMENSGRAEKIIVNTSGLSSIHPFGAGVFQKNCVLQRRAPQLIITGKHGSKLAPDESRHVRTEQSVR